MTEALQRWHRVRVIGISGDSSLSVAPETDTQATGVAIGWAPSQVALAMVPPAMRVPNSVFWVASDSDRNLLRISSERPSSA